MASGKLNSLSSERAHPFGGPVLLLSDGDGLYFRKQTREGAARMFRYRFGGRERWMTLGNYPDMNLAAARIEARDNTDPTTLLDLSDDSVVLIASPNSLRPVRILTRRRTSEDKCWVER